MPRRSGPLAGVTVVVPVIVVVRMVFRGGIMPDPARNQGLRLLARVQLTAEQDSAPGGWLLTGPAQAHGQRAAAVSEPQFV